MSYWRDKVAVVTGGSSGLGLGLARALVREGASVVLAARDEKRLATAVASLETSATRVLAIQADVTSADETERLFQQVAERFGRLDLLVNSAGKSTRGEAATTPLEEFRELLEVNFLATVRCCQAALPPLMESRGHVVNIGSLASKTAPLYLGAYPASKFATAAYSQQLRLELADRGVHVLLVCPGPIGRTDSGSRYDQQANALPSAARQPGGGTKLKRLDVDDVSARVLQSCERRKPELVLPARARLLRQVRRRGMHCHLIQWKIYAGITVH